MHIPGVSCTDSWHNILAIWRSVLSWVCFSSIIFVPENIILIISASMLCIWLSSRVLCVRGITEWTWIDAVVLCWRKKLFWCVQSANAKLARSHSLSLGGCLRKNEQKHHVKSSDKDQEFWEHDLERLNHRISSSCLARRDWKRHYDIALVWKPAFLAKKTAGYKCLVGYC